MDDRKINQLRTFFRRHRRMPSYAELARVYGFASKQSVARLVDQWRAAGIVDQDTTGRLIPGRAWNSVRVLGTVSAGFPTPTEEELLDTVTLDQWLIDDQETSYMLQVRGDSMKDAGIIAGDYVIAERTNQAPIGSIVIAEIDGEWTIKYLRQTETNQYYLAPANDAYAPMYPNEELHIAARVRGVIRKYQ